MRAIAISLAILLSFGPVRSAHGQTPEIDVMSVVASHLQPRLVGKVVIINDQYHPTRRSEAENQVRIPGQVLRLLERVLSGAAQAYEAAYECPGNTPDTCRLNFGADLLVTFSQPDIGTDQARVTVEERSRSTVPRRPTSFLAREVTLRRVSGVWTVTSDEVVVVS